MSFKNLAKVRKLNDTNHQPVLILPGYGNSDEKHWQSLWEDSHPNFKRVNQTDWESPVCTDWVNALEKQIEQLGPNIKVVAHSLGCLLVAHWAAQTTLDIAGALLVAVPDPEGDNFPKKALGFSPIPIVEFNFPSTIIASANDPYSNMSFSKSCAKNWGCNLIELGDFGHINSSSGLNNWPFGLDILRDL